MDTFSRTKRQFHLHLADTKQDLRYFCKGKVWDKKSKNYIRFIDLLSALFTASSIFFICASARDTTLFSPKNPYLTGISSPLPAPSFTHLQIAIADVLQPDSLKMRQKIFDRTGERGQQLVLNRHYE